MNGQFSLPISWVTYPSNLTTILEETQATVQGDPRVEELMSSFLSHGSELSGKIPRGASPGNAVWSSGEMSLLSPDQTADS